VSLLTGKTADSPTARNRRAVPATRQFIVDTEEADEEVRMDVVTCRADAEEHVNSCNDETIEEEDITLMQQSKGQVPLLVLS